MILNKPKCIKIHKKKYTKRVDRSLKRCIISKILNECDECHVKYYFRCYYYHALLVPPYYYEGQV